MNASRTLVCMSWFFLFVHHLPCALIIAQSPEPTHVDSEPAKITNSIGMQLTRIPSGEFMMGNSSVERSVAWMKTYYELPREKKNLPAGMAAQYLQHESPQHRVRITQPFYLGTYHVTVGQFRKFIEASGYRTEAETNPGVVYGFDRETEQWQFAYETKAWQERAGGIPPVTYAWYHPGFEQTDDHPVVNVTWDDAIAFCRWLSEREGIHYRLPTEAEWEYACRAGTDSEFYFGDEPDALTGFANVADIRFALKSANQSTTVFGDDGFRFTSPVGRYPPNAFGLHDMHGNAWQWCADWFAPDYYGISPEADPSGPTVGLHRALRGGSFRSSLVDSRTWSRRMARPNANYSVSHEQGFRVVMQAQRLREIEPSAVVSGSSPQPERPQPTAITNSIGLQLAEIPVGDFIMGGTEPADYMAEWNRSTADSFHNEHPAHRVRISRPFLLGRTHITRGQFRQFATENGYVTDAEKRAATSPEQNTWQQPGFDQDEDHPVVCVSWNDAIEFCKWLSRREGVSYRLPTEAEWEYACRAGSTSSFWYGYDPEAMFEVGNIADATYSANLPNRASDTKASDGYTFTSPVGHFRANAFGLYDMHGNALQWCADWFDDQYYASSPAIDPPGPKRGTKRVRRGGSWTQPPIDARSARRYHSTTPESSNTDCGFRVARDL